MATYTCPQGHTSQSGDYCDTCGDPIAATAGAAGAGSATPPPLPGGPAGSAGAAGSGAGADSGGLLDLGGPATGSTPASKACPNCQAANLPDALFCEDCGYDFTTGQLPRPLEPPTGVDTPAAPQAGQATPDQASVQAPPSDPAPPKLPPTATAPSGVEYVVEVWIDPDWYEAQDVTDPCPSPGMPIVVPLHTRTALVGRTSTSRNIHPEVDVSGDTGVSRRHAQLTSDGVRWWVQDLQSANGTYVGTAGAGIPTDPIAPDQKVEVPDDGRIYVGAWTRLVIRKATPADVAGS